METRPRRWWRTARSVPREARCAARRARRRRRGTPFRRVPGRLRRVRWRFPLVLVFVGDPDGINMDKLLEFNLMELNR